MSVIRKIEQHLSTLFQENRSIRKQSKYQIQYYNCWGQKNEDMYWGQFIGSRHLLENVPDKTFALFSVFGRREMIDKVKANFKVFYTAENVRRDNFRQYSDHCLSNPDIDLAMGFDYINDSRYVRFPLWMDYMFDASMTADEVRKKCSELRFPDCSGKGKLCCMVASNPGDGLRKEMYDGLSDLFHVDSAGRYLHNDDSLKIECGDRKVSYLSRYHFNICPENTNSPGYVTEKVFESVSCGCIPIYWGSELNPEPEVLNRDALILWDREDNGAAALSQVSELCSNPLKMREFLDRPRLLPTAEEYILDTFASIEKKFRELFSR